MNAPSRPVSFRVADCKEVVGVCRTTIYKMAKRGEITIYKAGSVSIILTEEWEENLRRNKAVLGD